jgi:hypothetical protein
VCTAAPADGDACFTFGTDACSPVTTPCSNGLQCFDGDPNSVVKCAVPSDTNGPCNPDTQQQGCKNSTDHCDIASRTCVPN